MSVPAATAQQSKRVRCLKDCSQAIASSPSRAESFKISGASLEPTRWDNLDGWTNDDHGDAFATFQASCRAILRAQSSNDVRPVRAALRMVCARAIGAGALDADTARRFFEVNFHPVRIRKLGDSAGNATCLSARILCAMSDQKHFAAPQNVPLVRPHPNPDASVLERLKALYTMAGAASRPLSVRLRTMTSSTH
jgi:hypothetical protein